MNARPQTFVAVCEAFYVLNGRYPHSCEEMADLSGYHAQTFYRVKEKGVRSK